MTARLSPTLGTLILASLLSVSLIACGSSDNQAGTDSDCTPEHQFSTVQTGSLTVAATPVPPFSMVDGQAVTGIDGDLITEFAAAECLSVKVVQLDFAGAVPAIQSDRADVATGAFYRTAARVQNVDMTDPIYLDEMAIVSKDGLTTVDQLRGLRVGTGDGFLWSQDLKGVLGDDLKMYPSALELFQDLNAGRLDVVIESYGVGLDNTRDKDYEVEVAEPDPRVLATSEPSQIGFPYTKGNSELGTALDAFIDAKRADGAIAELLEQYGVPASAAEVGEPRLLQ